MNRSRGTGCPFCAGQRATKASCLATTRKDIAREWHSERNGHLTPYDVLPLSHQVVWWKCRKGPDHEWNCRIADRVQDGSRCPFCSGGRLSVTNSLTALAPAVAKQWHVRKNGKLLPSQQRADASILRWWKCPRGKDHEWRADVRLRVHRGDGCPFCSGRRPSATNSLATRDPKTARLWHPTRNAPLVASDVTLNSRCRVWWKCPRGPDHEWRSPVFTCVKGTTKCPACVGLQVSVTNSLATRFPSVAAQWHPTKNAPLTPRDVTASTAKRVWWVCVSGHVWRTRISHRTGEKSGCPVCFGLSRRGRLPFLRSRRRRARA